MFWLAIVQQFSLVAQQYRFETYGQAQGLTSLQVQEMAVDRQGFVWVATSNGVFRFLGSRFEHLGPEQGLHERRVYQVHVDQEGRIWAGTRSNLYLWNGTRFTPLGGPPISLESGQFLLSVGQNRLLVNQNGQVSLLQLNAAGGFVSSSPFFSVEQRKVRPQLDHITSMAVGARGSTWFGCGKNICSFRDGSLEVWGADRAVPAHDWQKLFIDHQGSVWATSEVELLQLSPGSRRFQDRSPPGLDPHRYFPWYAIVEDAQGRLIVNTPRGLARREGDSWRSIGTDNGLATVTCTSLLIDANGDPWIGALGGATHWIGYRHWESWAERQGLPNSSVWSLTIPSADRILLGTIKGPALLDAKNRRIQRLWRGGAWKYGQVSGIAEDMNGNIWVSSFSGSILRIDPKTLAPELVANLATHLIRLRMAPDGKIWIVSAKGVDTVDNPTSSPVLRHASEPDQFLPNRTKDKITSMTISKRDVWIIGEHSLLRNRDGAWSKIAISNMDIAHVDLREMFVDSESSMWLAGENEEKRTAVWHLTADGAGFHAAILPIPEWLSSAVPYSIILDKRGWIWIGTDNGLAGWNGAQWREFNTEMGLPWNDTNRYALGESPDGSIWLGTPEGVAHGVDLETAFKPISLTAAITSAERGAEIFQAARIGDLRWVRKNLRFTFASPSTWNRSALSFKYRLLGLDSAWISTRDTQADFVSLSPGHYRFQILAQNPELGATSPPIESSFRVLPPWWRTLWFYVLCVLAGALLVWLLIWMRTRQLLLNKQKMQRVIDQMTIETNRLAKREQDAVLAEQRNRLAHELHDTMMGAFTGIFMQLEAASELASSDERRSYGHVDRAKDLSRDGLQKVRDFVQSLTVSGNDPVPSVEQMRHLVLAATEGTATKGTFVVEGLEKPLRLASALALARITQEAVGNAQRYANASAIVVTLAFRERAVTLQISDDGCGFRADEVGDSGFGITGMKARTKRLAGDFCVESAGLGPRSG